MKRSLLLISFFSIFMMLLLLSVDASGQNMTNTEDSFPLDISPSFFYFISIIITVVLATWKLASKINSQINGLKEDLEQKIDTKVREIKDDLEKQNAELKKGLEDKDERVRNLEISFGARLGAIDQIIETIREDIDIIREDIRELKQNIREDMKELREDMKELRKI